MRTKMLRTVWLAGCLAGWGGGAMAAQATEADHGKLMEALRASEEHVGVWERYPLAGIPLVAKAPTVDGVVDTREWFAAARLGRMVDYVKGLATSDRTDIYLCYTPTHLYIAFQLERPESARKPSPNDTLEILLDAWHQHARYYDVALNLEKVLWDGIGPNVDKDAWKPTWEYKARVTETGWEGEMSVAFKDFGLDGPPAPGTVWGADFVRNERTPSDRLAVWAFRGQNWHAVKNLGHLVWMGRPLALRVEDDGWILGARQAGVKLLAANFGDQPATLDVSLALRRMAEAPPLEFYPQVESAMAETLPAAIGSPLKKEVDGALAAYPVLKERAETVVVAPNNSKLIELTEPDDPGHYLALFSVRDGTNAVAGGLLPFAVSVPLAIRVESYLYSAQTLAYAVDLRRVGEKVGEAASLVVTARYPDGKAAAEETTAAIKGRQEVSGALHLEPRPDSTCVVEARIVEGGKTVARNEAPLRVPPKPAWLGNQIGKKKFVPEPWAPVRAKRQSCELRFAKFAWDGPSLLPQFTVFGRDIMAEPVALTFTGKDGQPVPVGAMKVRREDADQERAVFGLQGRLKDRASIDGTASVEYDGLVWFRLRVVPNGTLDLSGCTLRFKLKPEYSGLFTVGDNLAMGTTPASTNFPFMFGYWLGGADGGVQFLAENCRNWFNASEKAVVALSRDETGATLTVKLIDRPVSLTNAIDWAFGFIPTPSRVKPADWGRYAFYQTGGIMSPPRAGPDPALAKTDPGTYYKAMRSWEYFGGEGWKRDQKLIYAMIYHSQWQGVFGYPGVLDPALQARMRESVKWLHGLGIKLLVYAGWGMNTEAPEWKDYGMEMVRLPLMNSGYSTYRQCPTTLWQDWFVFKVAEMIRDYDIDGLFIDSATSPVLTENYTPGMRWIDEQGRVRGSYPILASREWLRRLYKLWHGELKPNGVIYNHNSPPAIMAIENFADVRCPSEFAQNYDGPLDRAFMDRFMAKNGGEQYGLFVEFTNKDWMGGWAKRKSNQILAAAIPLNLSFKMVSPVAATQGSYALDAQSMPWLWAARQWVDCSTAEYLPWWRNAGVLSTQPADEQVLSALWVQKGKKALLCVSNLKAEPREITVKLNLEKLGLPSITVVDALTGEKVAAKGDTLQLPVEFERYRLLRIPPAAP